ncbi:MAG: hypothetical protein HWQ41_00395 [Nostoc sp. NOS(2021)]|uniref:ribbon-helix-helix domain-containing protein n=1 Tax=Nostoc sp. NOS(2021) TaxID=2815407 RepID=UPI0025D9C3F4|nr:ribbon-helix-helix domain-containing protein [Nostoc sp. NOS(2021)]MBN3893803.1 hypothetical protein [Nostoc sp. NOS(2021)]
MPKKTSLNQALSDASKKPSKAESAKKVEPDEILADENSDSKVPPSRRGKRAIVGHFDPVVCKQLKLLAVEQDKSSQTLLTEALNLLFEAYGKQPIA